MEIINSAAETDRVLKNIPGGRLQALHPQTASDVRF